MENAMPLPHRRVMALLASIALASGCRDASPPEERVPSAVLTQSVSAAPTAATARPRRPAPQEPPSPLVEFDGLVQLEHKPLMVLKEDPANLPNAPAERMSGQGERVAKSRHQFPCCPSSATTTVSRKQGIAS